MAVKAKHQRLLLAILAVFALVAAAFIAAAALKEEASYFYTPTTLLKANPAVGQAIRIGGMVKPGSINRYEEGLQVKFVVQDQESSLLVQYTGITPDLFVEGSGVVADGRLAEDGSFTADSLLAKHDENYVPKELADIDMTPAKNGKTNTAS